MTNSQPSQISQPSKNALKHGLYAADVVLASENQQEFDDLLQAFQDEYCPDGVSEEAAVFDLASLHWKKRRLEAGLLQALQNQLTPDTTLHDWGMAGVVKEHSAVRQRVSAMILKHLEQLSSPDKTAANSQGSQAVDLDKLNELAKELSIFGGDVILPSLQIVEKMKRHQVEDAYQPQILEKELKIQAEIDKRIDRAMKRLVTAKEFKRIYGVKSAHANQIEAAILPAKSV